MALIGNREGMPELPAGEVGYARAPQHAREPWVLFAALVLAAGCSPAGEDDDDRQTLLGAQIE